MKFGFVTCVQLGLSCMEAIYDVGGKLDLAITLMDEQARAKSGRVYLDDFADRHGIHLCKVRNVNDAQAVAAIRRHALDWLFIIGWSQIAREEVLSAPRRGVIGMHPTLLPQGRGRAAIPWAILKGLDKTGVTMFQLDGGVDTGPILAQREIALTERTDATSLYAAVEESHEVLMRDTFPALISGSIIARPQDDDMATVWPGRTPDDGEIDLTASVKDADRLVRATTRPYPGAFIRCGGGKLIIWNATMSPSERASEGNPSIKFRDGYLNCVESEMVGTTR